MADNNDSIDGDRHVPATSSRVSFNTQLGNELCTHAHGQASVLATHECDGDDGEDLFSSSDSKSKHDQGEKHYVKRSKNNITILSSSFSKLTHVTCL